MKKSLFVLLALTTFTAYAGNDHGSPGQSQSQSQSQAQKALGGSSNVSVGGSSYRDTLQIPHTPPAIAPNINPATECDKSVVGSKARSTPLFGVADAGQSEVVVLGICVCYGMAEEKVRNRCVMDYTCESDPVFKKIHPKTCPANPQYEKDK